MTQNLNKIEQEDDDDFFDGIAEDDYVFIVDRDGNLKTMLCPDDESQVASDRILQLMEALGIDMHETHTLH